MCQDMTNIAPIVRKNRTNLWGSWRPEREHSSGVFLRRLNTDDFAMRNRKTAQTTPAHHVKNARKSVGRRLSPAVREDRYGAKKPRRVRDSEPRFAPGCGAVAALRQGAKPVQSPRALEGFESGTMEAKRKTMQMHGLSFWCTFRDSNPGPTD